MLTFGLGSSTFNSSFAAQKKSCFVLKLAYFQPSLAPNVAISREFPNSAFARVGPGGAAGSAPGAELMGLGWSVFFASWVLIDAWEQTESKLFGPFVLPFFCLAFSCPQKAVISSSQNMERSVCVCVCVCAPFVEHCQCSPRTQRTTQRHFG